MKSQFLALVSFQVVHSWAAHPTPLSMASVQPFGKRAVPLFLLVHFVSGQHPSGQHPIPDPPRGPLQS